MRPPLVLPESVTGFHDYFRLTNECEQVAQALGFTLTLAEVQLPHAAQPLPWVAEFQERLRTIRPRVRTTSETARREFFIAPILLELALHYEVTLRVETSVQVSQQLCGSFDYYIESPSQFLIVEAKNDDIERGFSQLVAEMVAMHSWTASDVDFLYGAVSMGTVWQFLVLNRSQRRFEQDLTLYRVPDELPDLCSVLVGILHLS